MVYPAPLLSFKFYLLCTFLPLSPHGEEMLYLQTISGSPCTKATVALLQSQVRPLACDPLLHVVFAFLKTTRTKKNAFKKSNFIYGQNTPQSKQNSSNVVHIEPKRWVKYTNNLSWFSCDVATEPSSVFSDKTCYTRPNTMHSSVKAPQQGEKL